MAGANSGEGTIISNGQQSYILKGGQWQPYQDPNAPEPFKAGDSDAIDHAWSIINSIDSAKQLATKPLATGSAATSITGIPVIGGLVGQNRADLQTKLGSIAGDLRQLGIRQLYEQTGRKGVGSIARSQSEQQALQNSLAPLGFVDSGGGHVAPNSAQPSAETLGQGLDVARNIYIKHLARLYNLNPDDPASARIITNAASNPQMRAMLLRQAQSTPPAGSTQAAPTVNNPTDHGITASAPPPAISGTGQDQNATSTTQQVVTDPNMARIRPQVEQMLAADPSKVSNQQIIDFMRQNNVDPSIYGGSLNSALQYRMSPDGAKWRARGGNYSVDPSYNKPLTGLRRAQAEISGFTPGGVPVGATVAGAADAATLGAIPDAAGVVNAVTGAGPTRAEVVQGRDVAASEHPLATLIGNALGSVASPLGRGGGLAKTALSSGAYGFFGSDNPDFKSRLLNAALASTAGAATHGVTNYVGRGGQAGYRAAASALGGPEAQTNVALARAADQMPPQDVEALATDLAARQAAGVETPAATVLSRPGQDFLARVASGSPAARAVADQAVTDSNKALPANIAQDFNSAISDAAEGAPHTAEFLNRPVRDIAGDVQRMAGEEFEQGIAPIKGEKMNITPELEAALSHERIQGAVRDALNNHSLDPVTRNELRDLPAQIKKLGEAPKGIPEGISQEAREAILAQLPKPQVNLSVDGARNIATALNRTADKLADGSEGQYELSELSKQIRQSISDQFPEYAPVNARYASRMRAKDAMYDARKYFLGDSPEQIDALAKSGENFTPSFNEPRYSGGSVPEQGAVLPSNQQFATAGAREAATTQAGAGTGGGAPNLLERIAKGPNQQGNNAIVLGNDAAQNLANKSAMRADTANVLSRIAKNTSQDQTSKWWSTAKHALAYKLSGGTAHYATANALASVPGITGQDAARVLSVYTNAATADQALRSLTRTYGAAKARVIMSRMAGMAAAGYTTRAPVNVGAPLQQ